MNQQYKLEFTPQLVKWYSELSFNDWVRFLNNHRKEHNLLRRLTMSLLDMGNMGLDDSHEPTAMPGDKEYKLRILGINRGEFTNKNGVTHSYIQPRLEIIEEPFAKEFTHFLTIPDSDMDARELNRVKWAMSSFCRAFELPTSGEVNPEDQWPGAEGYAILGLKETDDYGEQNFIKKLTLPK